MWCMPDAGRILLDTNSIDASGPTPRRRNDPRVVQRLEQSVGELARAAWPAASRTARGVFMVLCRRAYGPSKFAIVDGALVGDDVGVVGARDQDGDTETERRDLDRHRLTPALHGALGSRVRRGGRLTAHTGRAGYQHDAPFTRRTHRRQQRLGQRDGAQARWWRTSSATTPYRSPPPCRRRRFPRCAPARRVRRRLLRSTWRPRRSTRRPTGRVAHRSAGRRRPQRRVASRSSGSPRSGERMAATTRHPSR